MQKWFLACFVVIIFTNFFNVIKKCCIASSAQFHLQEHTGWFGFWLTECPSYIAFLSLTECANLNQVGLIYF